MDYSRTPGHPIDLHVVTPSDSEDLPWTATAFRVAIDGDVRVRSVEGTEATIPGVMAGEVIVLEVTRILATGTTADGITAFR